MDFSHGQVFFAPGPAYFLWGSLASYAAAFVFSFVLFRSWRSAPGHPRFARLLHGGAVVLLPLLAAQVLQVALQPIYNLPTSAQYFLCSGGAGWVWPMLLFGTGLCAWAGGHFGRRRAGAPAPSVPGV